MPRLKTKTNFKTKSFRILKCSKNLYSVDKSVQARNGLPFFSSQMIAKVGGAPYTRVRRIHENLRYFEFSIETNGLMSYQKSNLDSKERNAISLLRVSFDLIWYTELN